MFANMIWRSTARRLQCPNHVARVQFGVIKPGHSQQLCFSSTINAVIPPWRPTQASVRLRRHFRGSVSRHRTDPSNSVRGWDLFRAFSQHPILNASTPTPATTSELEPQHQQALSPYSPPSTGLLSHLPSSWVPYAELMRLDKPAGTYYLFLPCLFSTLLAATYTHPPLLPVCSTTLLFFAGALIMRGAGCTINDLWDRNLDPHVRRTRLRPIARGAVTPFQALAFTGVQLLAGLGILLQFPPSCFFYGVPSLVLVSLYPLAKRVTHYPQVVLGLTFSWGVFVGFPAMGIDLLADAAAMKAVAALYGSCVSWTVLYDMIYAHMDIQDDPKAGIKSIAVRHEKDTKAVLTGLAVVQIGLLATAGAMVGAGPVFFVGSCGSAAATLGWLIWSVRLKDASDCWWWFRNGVWLTGGGIASGLLAEYLLGSAETVVDEKASTEEHLVQQT